MEGKVKPTSSKSTSKQTSTSSRKMIDDIEEFDDDISDEISYKRSKNSNSASDEEISEDSSKSKKSKKDDSGSGISLGAKIAIFVVIIVVIILLLLKGCSKKKEYTVKFNANGGTTVSEQIVAQDGKVKIPTDPTKDGYDFVGWYVNGKKYDFDTKVTSDLEIEARWESSKTAAVTGVSLDQTSLTLQPGDKSPLVATVEPSDAKDTSVTWQSADTSIATVDEDGNVTAVAKGSTTVTVTTKDGDFKATCKVTVSEDVVKVTAITVSESNISLGVGDSKKIIPTIKPGDATNKGVSWSSDNEKVATVSSDGTIKGKSEGTAKITVITKDGDFEATINVTIKNVPVNGITLSSSNTTMQTGTTKQLTPTVKPLNATNKDVTWSSSDTSVATVNSNGKVTAKKAGTATITVTTKDGGFKVTCKVTVKDPVAVSSVKLSQEALTLTVGGSKTITATVLPNDAANKNVTWSSSDTSVATVSNGKITAKKVGTATIIVTTVDGKETAKCVVTVNEAPASYAIVFTPHEQEGTGSVLQYTYTVTKNSVVFKDYSKIGITGGGILGTYADKNTVAKAKSSGVTIVLNDGTKVSANVTIKN